MGNHLLHYAIVLISGIVDRMQLRRIPLDRAELDHEKARDITLRVVENLLASKV